MKKAISVLTSAVLALAIALPAYATGDLTVTQGNYQFNIQKGNGKAAADTTFDQQLTIDLKGNVNDSLTLEGRLLFDKNNSFSLRSTKFSDYLTFDRIAFIDYIIAQKSKIGPVDMEYDLRSFENDNGSFNGSSHDPLNYFDPQAQKIGKGKINFEARASYNDTTGRLGLVSGSAGRLYLEANSQVTPELSVGLFHNILYSGGVRNNPSYTQPLFAGFVGTTYATYKPKAIDGLTVNAATYFSRTPAATARNVGEILPQKIVITASQLESRGFRPAEILGKGYTFVWRGAYNGWSYGGNWNAYSPVADKVLFTEVDGTLVLDTKLIVDNATVPPTWGQMGKIVVFNTNGDRVADSPSGDHALDVFTVDPEGDKVSGGAAYVDAIYQKDALTTTFGYKQASAGFDAYNGNFYKNEKNVYGKDDEREETKMPVFYNNELRFAGEKGKEFTKFWSNTTYQFNENLSAELYLSQRDRNNAAVGGNWNLATGVYSGLLIGDLDYTTIKPKVSISGIAGMIDVDATLEYEIFKQKNQRMNNDAIPDAKGSILSYKIETTTSNPVKYVDKVLANFRSVRLDRDNDPADAASIKRFYNDDDDRKKINVDELYLEASSETINDLKFLTFYRLEARPYNGNEIDWYRSQTAGQVQYYGVPNLELRVKDLYVYDQTKQGSAWNWVIGSAKYSIKDTPYAFANNTTIRLLGKYNTIKENADTNKSAYYLEVLKSMPSSSLMFRYGLLSDDFTDYKHLDEYNEKQTFENTMRLEYRKNF